MFPLAWQIGLYTYIYTIYRYIYLYYTQYIHHLTTFRETRQIEMDIFFEKKDATMPLFINFAMKIRGFEAELELGFIVPIQPNLRAGVEGWEINGGENRRSFNR